MQNIYYICNAIFYKMQERFKQLLEEKNLTATRFAAMIKVNASAMSHILNGRSKPGFDVLDKIAQAFPDVNLNWLISGKGSLYNNRISTPAKEVEKIPVQKNLFEEEENAFLSKKKIQKQKRFYDRPFPSLRYLQPKERRSNGLSYFLKTAASKIMRNEVIFI